MNEDLKIDLYKKLINQADSYEKEAIKNTVCILLVKKCSNCIKEIYFYSSDLCNEGIDDFQLEYNIEFSNGEFNGGSCLIDTKEVMEAFGFETYDDLKTYFSQKYSDRDDAWEAIIEEMRAKGLDPSVDENEGEYDFMTNL
jgi:hypothetical protein